VQLLDLGGLLQLQKGGMCSFDTHPVGVGLDYLRFYYQGASGILRKYAEKSLEYRHTKHTPRTSLRNVKGNDTELGKARAGLSTERLKETRLFSNLPVRKSLEYRHTKHSREKHSQNVTHACFSRFVVPDRFSSFFGPWAGWPRRQRLEASRDATYGC